MKVSSSNPQTDASENNDANELETPSVQIADDSGHGMIKEVNLPRPQTNPRLKVQS